MHAEPSAWSASPAPPEVGDAAPDFILPARRGDATHLSALRGAPIVVVFHSPAWDPPRGEQVDGSRRRAASRSAHDVAPPVLVRNDHPPALLYEVAGRSAVFVVDERGAIAWRHIAGTDAVVAEAPRENELVGAEAEPARPHAWTWRGLLTTVLGTA